MTALSVILLTLLGAVAGVGLLIGRGLRSLRRELAEQNRTTEALRARMAERGRIAAARERMETAQRAAEGVVDVGNEGFRTTHNAIAEVPFAVLDQVAGGENASKAVRKVHDVTANGVYDAISFVNRLTGEGLRRGIHRDEKRQANFEEDDA